MRARLGAHGLLEALGADRRLCFVVAAGNATGSDQDKIGAEAGGSLLGPRGEGLGGDQGQEEEEEVEHGAGKWWWKEEEGRRLYTQRGVHSTVGCHMKKASLQTLSDATPQIGKISLKQNPCQS